MKNGSKPKQWNYQVQPLYFFCTIFIIMAFLCFWESIGVIESNSWRSSSSSTNYKKILLGNSYMGTYKSWQKILDRHLKGYCPESRCMFHTNHTDVASSDAVLFCGHNPYTSHPSKLKRLPIQLLMEQRIKDQFWVFMTPEPPPYIFPGNVSYYNGLMNWTMTYRRDSDVVYPFGMIIPIHTEKDVPLEDLIPSKPTKLAIWMSSRCHAISKREKLVQELQRYVDVDVMGSCGKPCGLRSITKNIIPGVMDPCNEVIQEYYFYMALENAICRDYISEKFFRTLSLGMIPIILGDAGHSEVAPPHSYVNAEDFETVHELADHLNEVVKNRTLYLSYHEWRRNYNIEVGYFSPLVCELCRKLHQEPIVHKVYDNLQKWVFEDAQCRSWKGATPDEGTSKAIK